MVWDRALDQIFNNAINPVDGNIHLIDGKPVGWVSIIDGNLRKHVFMFDRK
jgi:hypothetical protein